jgi:EpsI family protein
MGEDGGAGSAGSRRSGWLLGGLAAVLGILAYREALFWDPGSPGLPGLTWFFFGWGDTTPQLVLAVALALLVARRRRIAAALHGAPAPLPAAGLLALALALFLWGHHARASDLVVASLVPLTLGVGFLLAGPALARALLLPVLFLLFAVPLPGVLANQIVFPLQILTAREAAWLLDVMGTPVVREGDMLHFAHRSFEVIETCSGLRAIQIMTMLALAWVSVFRVHPAHAIALVGLAPLIAHGLNAVRVVALALDPSSDPGGSHSTQGVVTFVVGTLAVCAADALLRRWWPAPAAELPGPGSTPPSPNRDESRRRVAAAVVLLAALLLLSLVVPRHPPVEKTGGMPVSLPRQLDGWTRRGPLEVNRKFLGRVSFDHTRYDRYVREGEEVAVFVGLDQRRRRDRSLLSPKNVYPGPGWEPQDRSWTQLGPEGTPAELVLAQSGVSRVLTLTWYEEIRSDLGETVREMLATDQSFLRRPQGGLVFRVETELGPGSARDPAEARLRAVAERVLVHTSGARI